MFCFSPRSIALRCPAMRCLCCPVLHPARPLVVYIVMELLTLLCHVALLATGFRLRQLDGISYYSYRAGPQRLVPAMRYGLVWMWVHVSELLHTWLLGCDNVTLRV
jgi:hypothetical protein